MSILAGMEDGQLSSLGGNGVFVFCSVAIQSRYMGVRIFVEIGVIAEHLSVDNFREDILRENTFNDVTSRYTLALLIRLAITQQAVIP